jgi:hypothetical protein
VLGQVPTTESSSVVDEVAVLVARSRALQGLPPTVEDPGVLERIALVIATPGRRSAA